MRKAPPIDELTEPVEFFFGGDDLLPRSRKRSSARTPATRRRCTSSPSMRSATTTPELVFFEERAIFPGGASSVGMQFEGLPPGASTQDMPADAIYTVTEVYPDHVVLDGNHPLAGIALRLDARRCATCARRPTTEIEAGSVGEPGRQRPRRGARRHRACTEPPRPRAPAACADRAGAAASAATSGVSPDPCR